MKNYCLLLMILSFVLTLLSLIFIHNRVMISGIDSRLICAVAVLALATSARDL